MKAFGQDASFLSDLLQTLAERSRQLLGRQQPQAVALPAVMLARQLVSTRGEASGLALARSLLQKWDAMAADERLQWFRILKDEFGPDHSKLEGAVEAWVRSPTAEAALGLHRAAESLRQELFRRINLAPEGTATLVRMREALLSLLAEHPELTVVDADFAYLFSSWFNRGFLVLRRIDWSSSAAILEKIIRYESVHQISGWDELRRRVQPRDRRCFAFFHPQMPEDPLIFVEVALTNGIPGQISMLLSEDRKPLAIEEADTATFYSISNTQPGLKGISFGNFLIKQVVDELAREAASLKTFVTLSPLTGFADWLAAQRRDPTMALDRVASRDRLAILDEPGWETSVEARALIEPALIRAAASYLLRGKASNGRPFDPVARFHLGNGATLYRLNAFADMSRNGLEQAHGLMVNYLYDLPSIERNHEVYANSFEVVSVPAVRRLVAPESRSRKIAAPA